MPEAAAERTNQRRRTRRQLLEAAARLLAEGRKPSLEEVAEEALVSRATAYRYFSSIESLLLEASLHLATPDPSVVEGEPADATARVLRVEDAFHDMMVANETTLRLMLAQSLQRTAVSPPPEAPTRQNRRTPLIETALEPLNGRCGAADLRRLAQALSLLIGSEGFIAAKDVLQLDDAGARALKRWAIEALVRAVAPEA